MARARLWPHVVRLYRRRTPTAVAEALGRELRLRGGARLAERRLARAGRERSAVIAGPFLGELGFELLYWIPLLRRLTERFGIGSDQLIALSRGGAEPWYGGIAGRYVDAFDLLSPEEYAERLALRRTVVGDRKQLGAEALDRELLDGARRMTGEPAAAVLHPGLLYTRLRYFWAGERDLALVRRHASYAPIPTADRQPGLPGELPPSYVAVKAYFSDCFPENETNRSLVRELVSELARSSPVIMLPGGFRFDDHADAGPAASEGIVRADAWMTPRDNLAVQTEIVRGASALVATYGGFSYIAPHVGVRAATFYTDDNFNRTHLAVLRSALPALGDPAYAVTDLARDGVGAVLEAARAPAPV